jgi:DtxR family transcriptional regulator, Mn-dependent transcriptional regulator
MLSSTEENYLKAIHTLESELTGAVSTNAIADRIETKASSVTDMVRKLSEKKLVDYTKYKGVSLSEEGRKVALRIIRKHRLWEVFLVEKLNFGWDEVHVIAEQLEHIQSVKLTNCLDEFLGFPKFDPHGDPIPDQDGQIFRRKKACLLDELEIGVKAIVVGVNDSSPAFLQYLDKQGIRLGDELAVLESFTYDNSLLVELRGAQMNLSHSVVSNLCVEPKS